MSPSVQGEFIATIPTKAVRNGKGEQYYPTFNVSKTAIQEQIGIRLTSGGFYHIVGTVEGAFDFDIHRVIKTHLRMMTPLEHRDKVEFGKVYNLRVKSFDEVQLSEKQREIAINAVGVQYRPLMYRLSHMGAVDANPRDKVKSGSSPIPEKKSRKPHRDDKIGATFSPIVRLQSGRDRRLYFRIDYPLFRQRTGIEIDEGGFYKIGGRIEGVGSFQKTLRSLAARQDLPFYVPKHLKRKLKVGEECKVVIDWVEKLPEAGWTVEKVEIEGWTWKEVASWIDTEGTIFTGHSKRYLSIGQKEKRIIQEIRAFLEREGVSSSLRLDKHTGVYYVVIDRVDHIAKVIRNVEPFIRTENKKREIEAFKEDLTRHRNKLRTSVIQARNILGIEQK